MLLIPHQDSWVDDFKRIKEIFLQHLSGLDIEVEHIGSTAVPDLPAKAIIDIDIIYERSEAFEIIKKRLEDLGYVHHDDQDIKGREVFKLKGSEDDHIVLNSIRHHLYVCHVDNEELQRHLIFRDFLRENQLERKQYEQLKQQIALKQNQDHKAYARLKESVAREFIDGIIMRAKEN
ncbi:MAG: GrpB family protein [Saprospiraceae bacterium]|nr:GrpB family protein [Saprospiraceae bacterium]